MVAQRVEQRRPHVGLELMLGSVDGQIDQGEGPFASPRLRDPGRCRLEWFEIGKGTTREANWFAAATVCSVEAL